jgi:hypothetical protein
MAREDLSIAGPESFHQFVSFTQILQGSSLHDFFKSTRKIRDELGHGTTSELAARLVNLAINGGSLGLKFTLRSCAPRANQPQSTPRR